MDYTEPIDTAPYKQVHRFSVNLGQEKVELVTKLGLPSWYNLSPTIQLFLDNAVIHPQQTVLLCGCHLGPLAVALARKIPSLHLIITDINHTALEMTRFTLQANKVQFIDVLADIALPPELYQKVDVIFIQIPKGRLLARRWLIQAKLALAINGSLYLGGANNSGIQSVIRDAQALFGNGRVLAYKKGNRIAQHVMHSSGNQPPDWAETKGIAPGTWVEFPVNISDHTFDIRSLPGVFSYDHLDEGTEILLRSISIPRAASVLDVGCGYGLIGLVAITEGANPVHWVDNNLLAIASCKATLAINGNPEALVFTGDLLDPVEAFTYDLILSNPPFHTGHAVNVRIAESMIRQSFQALNPGGQLIIVANRFLRYKHLIETVFGNVSTLSESGKFHVLSGLKSG